MGGGRGPVLPSMLDLKLLRCQMVCQFMCPSFRLVDSRKDVVTLSLVLDLSTSLTVPLAVAEIQNYGDSNIVHKQSSGFIWAVPEYFLQL